jgi:hypothetical protein
MDPSLKPAPLESLQPRRSYYARARASLHARAPRHSGKVAGGLAALLVAAVVARLTGIDLSAVLRVLATLQP